MNIVDRIIELETKLSDNQLLLSDVTNEIADSVVIGNQEEVTRLNHERSAITSQNEVYAMGLIKCQELRKIELVQEEKKNIEVKNEQLTKLVAEFMEGCSKLKSGSNSLLTLLESMSKCGLSINALSKQSLIRVHDLNNLAARQICQELGVNRRNLEDMAHVISKGNCDLEVKFNSLRVMAVLPGVQQNVG